MDIKVLCVFQPWLCWIWGLGCRIVGAELKFVSFTTRWQQTVTDGGGSQELGAKELQSIREFHFEYKQWTSVDFILISAIIIIIIPLSKMNVVSDVFLQDCFRTLRETKIHTNRHREYYSRQQVTFEEWSVTDRDMVKQRTPITGNILLVWLSVDFFSFSDLSSMCRYSQSTQKYVVVGALNKASVVGCSH